MQTTPDLDSREQLALSIHRVLRSEIRARTAADDLRVDRGRARRGSAA
jgi:hypothetical protein